MGTHRHATLPYAKALQAMAFAGLRITSFERTITGMGFLLPPDRFHIYQYKRAKFQARSYDKEYILMPKLIEELDIDPLYSWGQALGNPTISPQASFCHKVIEESRHRPLRKIIDILLFLGKTPAETAELLKYSSVSPAWYWSEEEISFYQKFFWDTNKLFINDWQEYASWMPDDYRLPYITYFVDEDLHIDDLLTEAGVPLHVDPDEMAKVMLRDCYMSFRRAKTKSEKMEQMRIFRSLYTSLRKESIKELRDVNTAEKEILKNLKVHIDGTFSHGEPITINDLEGADISDNLSQEQNRFAERPNIIDE